jgi:hypothetical protein
MDDNYDQVYDDIHLSSNSSSIWSFRSVLRLLSVRAPNFNAPAAVLLLPSIDPSSSNRPFISRSIDRSIATHLVRVLERWDCWRFGLTMGLGSPVPCLEADGGSGWTLWCAVLSKCLFFTTSQVPIFTYNQPPLSLSLPQPFISCSILSIFLFKLHYVAEWQLKPSMEFWLLGSVRVALDAFLWTENVSVGVNGANSTTGHPHDMIKA